MVRLILRPLLPLVLAGCAASQHIASAAGMTLPNVPGAIATTDTTAVCTRGYSSHVRPRSYEWKSIKRALRARAGLRSTWGFVADHDVPLELGGAPRDLRNIWLQPYSEAHAKDRVEDELHILVCDGRMRLTDAQKRIAHNWTTAVPRGTVLTRRERALLDWESTPSY